MGIRQLTRRAFLAAASAQLVAACQSEDDETTPTSTGGTGGAGGGAGGAGGGGTGGAGGGGPTGPGPEPDPWEAPGLLDMGTFAWGVQVGDVTPTSALVSARTLEDSVAPTLLIGLESGWEEVASGQLYDPVDGVVHFELTGLVPDHTYSLVLYGPGGIRRSRVHRFRTAVPPGASRVIRFGATSCMGPTDEPFPNMTHSLAEPLDFFLLVGDAIYADYAPDQFDYVEKYKTALSQAGMLDTCAATSVVATWDDHELDDNWSWATPGMQQTFDEALAAFQQAIPYRQGGGVTGLWRKLSWGDALDLFVLDCRGERLNGNYVSPEQLTWLEQSLLASTATFKVIVNSVPIFDFTGTVMQTPGVDDRWQGFPAQRDQILQYIRDHTITGVVWISGDVHFGAVGQVDIFGGPGDNQWDVFVGPSGSAINPAVYLLEVTERMPVLLADFSTTIFEADPVAGTLRCRFVGDAGQTLADHTLQLI
ncbi:MAG: alkaline phosphatase D family protein [Deltaproteobacteria bacterium]|nr:alkaline phosphatase D family protein [Deltaproteobacteria bacterium]